MIAGRKITDESIYGLIYEPEVVPQKPARYKSMYSSNVKEEKKQHKSEHATMGQAKVPLLSPEKFLAKHSKEFKLPAKKQFNYPDQDTCRPLVPMIDDKPVMGLKSNKNFITTNAVENITSIPKKAVPKVVDTRGGDTHPLDASGLAPKYVKKKL
ncbi:PREDICTED: enkurin-like [Priapulus caudatus]|uniref:Enkurin-like n=1 Tax=Priapulus caudatus TaxID=37621 RepID=A0ABM1F8R1_PRICU|nr:PREDICTED: enkurin-like [Priapulus caudatus]